MDSLLVTRARFRRRYGNDSPEHSTPSRFLAEIPRPFAGRSERERAPGNSSNRCGNDYARLFQPGRSQRSGSRRSMAIRIGAMRMKIRARAALSQRKIRRPAASNSAASGGRLHRQHRAVFWRAWTEVCTATNCLFQSPRAALDFATASAFDIPKYGEGVVFHREGDGEDAKITVQFHRFGIKKLVEKFAQLERV